ncbi:hypothetical protein JTE90_019026 [Oedothorax gibbosus]|uniref:Uncharacterized protein n=1 Tax=Oedothorax gibbosus TaxID=931172 RepID=A0AAV6V0K6_9ARAC|nr:hypothetical protein JTE90_019026 [Oedothorax gibbosus]
MPLKHGQPLNPPLSHIKGLGGMPKRDRSRSLCVDRSTPLLPRWGEAAPKASPPFLGRRGSASGIVGIFHTTNMLLWCHPLAECESPRWGRGATPMTRPPFLERKGSLVNQQNRQNIAHHQLVECELPK